MIEGFFWLAFLGIGAIVLYVFVSKIIEWNRNNHAPQEALRARLINKEENFSNTVMPVGDVLMPADTSVFTLVFRTETGEEKKYIVTKKIYTVATQGATGVLQFQGTRFLAFVPD